MQLTNDKPAARSRPRAAPPGDPADVGAPSPSGRRTRSQCRARLLDAAELLFADRGYAECTFREIADRSGINQGLLHYYFRTKENLFSEVFLRRAAVVAEGRAHALDEAERRYGKGGAPVEAIVRAFLEPTLRMAQQGPSGRAFLRIHSLLRSEPGDLGLALRRKAFGASTERFVEALCHALPGTPKTTVCWRFNFMVGAYLVVTTQSGRLEDYSHRACSPNDVDAALDELVPFITAGFMSAPPAADSKRPRSTARAKQRQTRKRP